MFDLKAINTQLFKKIVTGCLSTFLFFLTLLSCQTVLDEKAMEKYISKPKHGLTQEKEINGTNIRVVYKPQDLLVKQSLNAILKPTGDTIEKIKNQYYTQIYFMVSISLSNHELLDQYAGNRHEFSKMVKHLTFSMAEHITLTSGTDTIEMVDYICPRTFGLSNSTNMLFAFKNFDFTTNPSLKLIFSDPELRIEDVCFDFNTKDILKLPKLKLQ